MKKIHALFGFVFVAITGCVYTGPSVITLDRQQQNPYYVSSPANPPLLEHKGDMLASIISSTGDKRGGIDFGLAYKPAKYFGIIGNFSMHTGSVNEDRGGYYGHWMYTRTELGAGYSRSIGKAWMAECYAGGGFGNTANDHGSGDSKLKQNYLFIQPAIGYHNPTGNSELGFVVKVNRMHINIAETNFDPIQESFTSEQFALMQNTPNYWFIDPGIIYRVGWKYCKFQLGINCAVNITESALQSKNLAVAAGVVFKFNTAKKI